MKYTKELVQQLLDEYAQGKEPLEIAQIMGVPKRSVVAKLSSLGVYKRKSYVNKLGEPPRRKSDIVSNIGALLDVPPELCDSLDKCSKFILIKLEAALKELK